MRLLAILFLVLAACSTEKAFIPFDQLGVYSNSIPGGVPFKDIGPISTTNSSFVWTSCETVATDAVRELIDLAKVRGANTVYNITFDSKNGRVATPTCLTRWGWFVAYILPGFGPWMVTTSVDGIAAKKEDVKSKTSEIHITPNSDSLELASAYVSTLKQ